jgi:glucose-6-phosphate isomerase
MSISFDQAAGTLSPAGPTLTRRMSDLEGLFRDQNSWRTAVADGDPIVYSVVSTASSRNRSQLSSRAPPVVNSG